MANPYTRMSSLQLSAVAAVLADGLPAYRSALEAIAARLKFHANAQKAETKLQTILGPEDYRETVELLRSKRKINAIKHVREATGAVLKDARDLVEDLEKYLDCGGEDEAAH